MASICNRFITRASPFTKSAVRFNGPKSPFPGSAAASSTPYLSLPVPSLLLAVSPLGTPVPVSIGTGMCTVTVASTQYGGDGNDDVMPEHNIEELPISGYTLLHLSRPLVLFYLFSYSE
ncbi:hypothetical protein F3Y22_tig00002237pilonHSYRG01633 [Hibiscus syriacus]|uniref:Uncharacterized protein n=1 Tax=Hibiscus syriacus TaxID=106335 RepID=A0A6A3CSU4_HIBSY|nr:hypothetical protein F3Y22_tig00002237pilonHSYRG01633 [Hibiscus syriacus]